MFELVSVGSVVYVRCTFEAVPAFCVWEDPRGMSGVSGWEGVSGVVTTRLSLRAMRM